MCVQCVYVARTFCVYICAYTHTVAITMYVRYHQLAAHLTTVESPHPERVNKVALGIGLTAAFGMTLVANFQVGQLVSQRPVTFDANDKHTAELRTSDVGLHMFRRK